MTLFLTVVRKLRNFRLNPVRGRGSDGLNLFGKWKIETLSDHYRDSQNWVFNPRRVPSHRIKNFVNLGQCFPTG